LKSDAGMASFLSTQLSIPNFDGGRKCFAKKLVARIGRENRQNGANADMGIICLRFALMPEIDPWSWAVDDSRINHGLHGFHGSRMVITADPHL
jgi:hypothetical protein